MSKRKAPPPVGPALRSLQIEYRPAAALVPYERNARTHSPEQIRQIAAAMRDFGWTNPVLVDAAGVIVAGHGRLEAAKAVWAKGGEIEGAPDRTVPCIVVPDLTPERRAALTLADNRIALNAGWDIEILAAELLSLKDAGFDLQGLGFSPDEVADLLSKPFEGLGDPDAAPPLPAVPVSRDGDVWLLGGHRLVCGDSTVAMTAARAMGQARPVLMVTDPPYGVSYDPSWRQKAGIGSAGAAEGKVRNDDRADWREAWALFPGAVAYVWHGGLHAATVAQSLAAVKMNVRAQIVWVKTRPAISRGDYHWQHEPCLYAVREGEDDGWRFQDEHELAAYAVRDGRPGGYRGGRKQSTVWMIEHLKSETGHGTQKPVEAMRRPIENNSRPGDVVYEPFSGSGTTLIACQMTGRLFAGIELDPGYVDVAVRRWETFTGMVARLEADDRPFAAVAAQRGKESDGGEAAGAGRRAVEGEGEGAGAGEGAAEDSGKAAAGAPRRGGADRAAPAHGRKPKPGDDAVRARPDKAANRAGARRQ